MLSIAEYKKLAERAVPEYYLTGKAARDLDKLVETGLRDYRAGKTVKATSVQQALEDYNSGKCRIIKSLADLE